MANTRKRKSGGKVRKKDRKALQNWNTSRNRGARLAYAYSLQSTNDLEDLIFEIQNAAKKIEAYGARECADQIAWVIDAVLCLEDKNE
jgi:hypothetical protein